ncbi:type 11 methyltransferase [Halosimplex carlsbadense 2-9-1]|uniref:Type 11 methyltransferase n=1 Tax=Halosimplex carlsbadense 2-9-1 TaxID=797114 RepID=M0CJK1_9EURY|nr:class I SAM-dependent methyltransferase [Halosimplex carlsbadense]ELZ22522.1 type 11 methyltransferase [Halosimplex carlsbadense 2-9-1]
MAPDDPFASAESHYGEHRPRYGDRPLDSLVDRFDLDKSSRALDLGCGTGQIAVPLAARVGRVLGVDPNEAMLDGAREAASRAGVESVEFVRGSDADLRGSLGDGLGPFDLTTVGRAFHWMERGPTLDRVRELTNPGGGVAVFGDTEWLTKGRRGWQDEVYDCAASHLDDLPERTGPRTEPYENPYDELLTDHGFEAVETATFERTREWSVDGVVGYVFSLSFCSPARFGDEREDFETEVRERLDELGGPFGQDDEVRVISGQKPD